LLIFCGTTVDMRDLVAPTERDCSLDEIEIDKPGPLDQVFAVE